MRRVKIKHSNKVDNYEKTELDLEIEKELLEDQNNNQKVNKSKK